MGIGTSELFTGGQARGLAALLFAAFSLRAQVPQAALDLQTEAGQTTFHVGERIPLKLTFSIPNDPGRPVTDNSDFLILPVIDDERGGEFDCKNFQVTPATGWSDPLATYFAQNRDFPQSGHGWPAHPLMAAKPETATVDLNQWIRFDAPGDYTVTVTSHCVQRKSPPSFDELRASIELHIVAATERWQAEKLQSILAQLRLQRGTPAWESAVKDLRYLATPAGVEEMTSGFRNTSDGFTSQQWAMGLDGLPESLHGMAIDSMEKRIEEPDFPVSPQFFATMTFLHVTPGSNNESIREQTHGWAIPLWMEILGAVHNKTGIVLTPGSYQSRLTLAAKVPPLSDANQQPDARAQTIQTLVTLNYMFPSPQVKTQLGRLLRGSFLSLDQRAQLDDLRAHWDELNSPDLLPVLKSLAEKPLKYTPRFGDFAETDLKSLAYFRWYQLDPAGAQKQILAEIGSDSPTLPALALAFLPPQPMPDLEPIWLREFLGSHDQLTERAFGSLLVKFGTGAATAQMIAKLSYQGQPNPCDAHIVVLAYVARFAPVQALPLLRSEFDSEHSQCGNQMLGWIAELAAPAPVLEQVAIEELNGTDTPFQRAAIEYLESFGSKQDEALLWRRYVQWSDANKDNAVAFDRRKPDVVSEMSLGNELALALMRGQGWLADKDMIARALAKCVGKQICDNLESFAGWTDPPYQIMLSNPSLPIVFGYLGNASVAQYNPRTLDLFDRKIAQYPPGSHFVIYPYHPSTGDEMKLEDQVKAILSKNGMVLDGWKN